MFISIFQVVSFDEFNRGIQMIGNTALRNEYKECISELGRHFHHPHYYLGLGMICIDTSMCSLIIHNLPRLQK